MTEPSKPPPDKPREGHPLTGEEVYRLVSDTVTGVNVRGKDNAIQAVAIAICVVIGTLIGALATRDHLPGAMVGAFAGLLAGVLISGSVLMVYRAVRHLRGRHD